MPVNISKVKGLQTIGLSTTKELQKIGLSTIQIQKFEKLKATPRPMSAKVTSMGFDPKLVSALPKSVQALTKADLLALGGWGGKKLSPAASRITVTEIQQIRDVFGKGIAGAAGNPLAIDIYCCCCPCCCAATVTTPVSIKKEKTLRA